MIDAPRHLQSRYVFTQFTDSGGFSYGRIHTVHGTSSSKKLGTHKTPSQINTDHFDFFPVSFLHCSNIFKDSFEDIKRFIPDLSTDQTRRRL